MISFRELVSAELPFGSLFYEKGDIVDRKLLASIKGARIANFLAVPLKFEKLIWFGFWICFDNFLWPFTILPLHMVAIVCKYLKRSSVLMTADEYNSLNKFFLILITSILMRNVDASRLYHSIRGQSALKLYVIYNALEICDKLCCAFGHDIMDALFSVPSTNSDSEKQKRTRSVGPVAKFVVGVAYLLIHTMTLSAMLATLNVAMNSYSNSLLTLLMSNQFVELKGAVFKRYERENLFQLSSSDIIERFQMFLFLLMIFLRNLLELYPRSHWAAWDQLSLSSLESLVELFGQLLTPILIVWLSEILVDWLKHSFIAKFNGIDSKIYYDCRESLQRNLMGLGIVTTLNRSEQMLPSSGPKTFVKASNYIAKRIGFISLPLVCLCVRVSSQLLDMMFSHRFADDDSFDPEVSAFASQFSLLNAIARIPQSVYACYNDPWDTLGRIQRAFAANSGLFLSATINATCLLLFWLFLLSLKIGLSWLIYRTAYGNIHSRASPALDTKVSLEDIHSQSPKRRATSVNNVKILQQQKVALNKELDPVASKLVGVASSLSANPEMHYTRPLSPRNSFQAIRSEDHAPRRSSEIVNSAAERALVREDGSSVKDGAAAAVTDRSRGVCSEPLGLVMERTSSSAALSSRSPKQRQRSRTLSSTLSTSSLASARSLSDKDTENWASFPLVEIPSPFNSAKPAFDVQKYNKPFNATESTSLPASTKISLTQLSPTPAISVLSPTQPKSLRVTSDQQAIDLAYGRVEFGRSQSQLQHLHPELAMLAPNLSLQTQTLDTSRTSTVHSLQATTPLGHSPTTTTASAQRRASADVTRLDAVDRFTMYKSRIV